MPAKLKKKKSAKSAKKKAGGSAKEGPTIAQQLKKLNDCYEIMCLEGKSKVDPQMKPTLKQFMDDSKFLVRFVLQGGASPLHEEPPIRISPLIKALRTMQYTSVKEFYFWDIGIPYEDCASLAAYCEQVYHTLMYLEIVDCDIDAYSIERFSRCFQLNTALTTLVMDYSNIGDDGVVSLCKGLQTTATVTKLSLCYCGLSVKSGGVLGDLVAKTSINELYVDGNNLECQGLLDLLSVVVDQAEADTHKRNNPEAAPSLSSSPDIRATASAMSAYGKVKTPPPSAKSSRTKSSKKKGKKGKKKSAKKPPEPPRVGPWLDILHASNNGIDSFSTATTFAPVLTMKMLGTWIRNAETLKELDIDDNLIGDLGGREIMNALEARKEAGLDGMFVRVTHRLNGDTFKQICSLGSGTSKRGGKKKKKKGKAGKKRVK